MPEWRAPTTSTAPFCEPAGVVSVGGLELPDRGSSFAAKFRHQETRLLDHPPGDDDVLGLDTSSPATTT